MFSSHVSAGSAVLIAVDSVAVHREILVRKVSSRNDDLAGPCVFRNKSVAMSTAKFV